MKACEKIAGGVTAARGFRAAGVHAGIKADRKDLAVVVADQPAVAAGVFTTNRVQAAPVILSRKRLAGGRARAVLINSGSANACTGREGMADAERSARLLGEALGVDPRTVLVCSTGCIGTRLPMDKIEAGIAIAARSLSGNGGQAAAEAIMTTDTYAKQSAVELKMDGAAVRVGGMAKGAGMIEPNLATMLAVMTTDAAVEPAALRQCLTEAAEESFNRICVDGSQSTNDTLLFLASGAAGNRPLRPGRPAWERFAGAVRQVAEDLALQIVRDGEGATKFVTVRVNGAANDEEARRAARAVANSLLVKTSWFGGDPNWGRVMDAVGYSGARFRPERVEIWYDGLCAVKGGKAAGGATREALAQILKQTAFVLRIELRGGKGTDTVYTCDCTYDYVKINAEYTT